MFLQRLGSKEKDYLTMHEFLTRFWAAYTYEDIQAGDEDIAAREEQKDKTSGKISMTAIMDSVS